MASIKPRLDQKTPAWRVRWRIRDTQEEQGLTFHDEDTAKRCRKIVEGHDHQIDESTAWNLVHGLAPEAETSQQLTLNGWYERWIQTVTGVEERTREDYRRQYRLRMRNVEINGKPFGEYALDDITPEIVARWVATLPAVPGQRKIGAVTIGHYHAQLSQMFGDALFNRVTSYNPTLKTKLPKPSLEEQERKDHCYLTYDEAHRLVACAEPGVAQDLMLTLLGTGLRWGEVTALRKRDLIWRDDGTVWKMDIRRAWKYSEASGWYIGTPKSKASKRQVSVSRTVAEILANRASAIRLDDLMFTFGNNIRIDGGGFSRKQIAPAVARAELEKNPTPHDFRHTHVSWLIDQNQDPLKIQKRLGHESIKTTYDIYGHLMPTGDVELLEGLDKVLPVI